MDNMSFLISRHSLHLQLPDYLARSSAAAPLSLVLFAMQDFRIWQEQLTPLACDALLGLVAERLRLQAPADALLCRWDHSCFALLLPCCPLWQAEDLAERIQQKLPELPLPEAISMHNLQPRLDVAAVTAPPCPRERLLLQAEEKLACCRARFFQCAMREEADYATREACLKLVSSHLAHSDPYLRRHSELTAGFCRSVGVALQLPEQALDELVLAAAIADLTMPQCAGSALDKPGCLTLSEYNRVRRHADSAAEIAKRLSLSRGVWDTVACHHVRLDGCGYPRLVGERQAPLSAYIVGCCGAYAAMLLPRPYRPALKAYQAKAELSREAGRGWPREVVREVIGL